MEEGLEELVEEFVAESKEQLQDIESELLLIEQSGANQDPELINKVFRAVHSIKGAAGFLGLSCIGDLSHGLEEVLDSIRKALLLPTEGVVEALLKGADKLSQLVENVELSNEEDVSNLVEMLKKTLGAKKRANPTDSRELTGRQAVGSNEGQSDPLARDAIEVSKAMQGATPKSGSQPYSESEQLVNEVASGPSNENATTPNKTAGPASVRTETNVRVPVALLDDLMNLAGELVLGRNQLLQAVSTNNRANLEYVVSNLDQVTSGMQEAIMQTRMRPLGNVFNKFPRIVRDLSRQLGKRCNLIIEGSEVDLDKSIIEAIGAPLTHLIRNSLDHGIELPEARIAKGKNPEGSVGLRAFHQGGKVHIEISDDGKGIDPVSLKKRDCQKKCVSDRRALTSGKG